MSQLVLLRHGQSQWNRENRFTGWVDVDLSPLGVEEARSAGRLLRSEGFDFDRCFTSLLTRAIRTLWLVQEEMGRLWLPVEKSWRLNERHYGALQGKDKAETAAEFGDEQVLIWRRSFDVPPPLLSGDDPGHPARDPRYARIPMEEIGPSMGGESLEATVARLLPLWHESIAPALRAGERVLVAAHGNSLRALVMHLDGLDREAILGLNIPTGVPLFYHLDEALRPRERHYLGDPEAIRAAAEAVAKQGSAKDRAGLPEG